MVDTNIVVLIGRLTRDAVLTTTKGGTSVLKFSIAVNKSRKSGDTYKDEAHFFEVVVWGKLAETLSSYLVKGKQVSITGELNQERWSDEDEHHHSKVTVTASSIQLLSGGKSANNNADSNSVQQQQESSHETSSGADDGDFTDEIPW